MRRFRYVAVAVLGTVTAGSLLLTGGYAWYLRSARYRNFCAATLSQSLGLPSTIAQVVPRSRQTREFRDVHVWLPERRGEAAYCQRALLHSRATPDDPDGYELELRGGRTEISTRTWLREDYRIVLESGLRPVFDPAGPRRVAFSGMDLAFQREGFGARLHDASGEVSFVDPHLGQAVAVCREFNGHVSAEPVVLRAQFSPQARGLRLDRIELTVPELPIAIVGLGPLTGIDLQAGSFGGRLTYREFAAAANNPVATRPTTLPNGDRRELTVAGRLYHLQLAECTQPFFTQPWRGAVPELELEDLTLLDEHVQRLCFRGVLTGLVLGDVLAPWQLGGAGGDLVLRVRTAELSSAGIVQLIASASCENISLANLSRALGWGELTGRARLVVDDLTIVDNRVTSLDAELTVTPEDGTNFVDRRLVSAVLQRTVGLTLPAFLPDRLPYGRLGIRFEIRDEVLHIFGTSGPHDKTILSMKVGDQEIPVILEPEQTFDLRAPLDALRTRLLAQLAEHLSRVTPETAWRALAAPRERSPNKPPQEQP